MTQEQQTDAEQADPVPDRRLSMTLDADVLTTILDAITAVNESNEGIAQVSPGGIRFTTASHSNVMLADVMLPADAAETYTAGMFEVGIDADLLGDMVAGETVSLRWDEDAGQLAVESGPVDAMLAVYDTGVIPQQGGVNAMRDDAPATVTLPAGDWRTALRVAGKVASDGVVDLTIEPAADFIGLRKRGDTDEVSAAFESADLTADPGQPAVTKFADGFLKAAQTALPTGAELTVHAGDGIPAVIEYDHEGVHVVLAIAPRLGT